MLDKKLQDLKTKLEKTLEEKKTLFGLDLNDKQISQLIGYLGLLNKWNATYNLTAIRNIDEMFVKHLLDSLVIAKYIKEKKIIDVGTGAGLPGIPLAIIYPEKEVTLLDSNGKKTRFLEHVKMNLKLNNIQIVNSRAEKFKERKYEAVTSRAFTSLENMLNLCSHLCEEEGFYYPMKGALPEVELAEMEQNYILLEAIKLQVPELEGERHLLKIGKNSVSKLIKG